MVESYIYFYHLDKQFSIPVTPESIQNTASITFSQEAILGRSAPQVTFSNAGPREQTVSLTIHRQMMDLENLKTNDKNAFVRSNNALDTTDELINALIASTLPKYDNTYKAIIPPSVRCRFGNESEIIGVLSSGVTQTSSGVWLKNGKMSTVTLSFTILEVPAFSASYAFQHGFLRGISTDLARSSAW